MAFSSIRRTALAGLMGLAALASNDVQAFQGKVWATGLNLPLFVTAPKGDKRVFVVEQPGAIKVFKNGQQVSVYLDLSSIINPLGTGGLLGLAFDPDYET